MKTTWLVSIAIALPLMLAALPVTASLAQVPALPAAEPHEPEQFTYLNATDFLPQRVLSQPPALGSPAETLEMTRVRSLIAAATPERLAQAKWDGKHEDPSAFNDTIGRDIAKLPAASALLAIVQHETEVAVGRAKDAFGRVRPYGVDHTLPTCTHVNFAKAARSYPSGHASMGYAVGWTLARLLPQLAPAILSRADDYALSRELCGVHFHSDTEASHVLATLIADRLLVDPRLADKVAAARAELSSQ